MSCFAAYFCLECSRALLLSPSVCLRCSCRDDTPYSSFPSDMGSWSLFTDHAGTLSSPLLNPLKICCIYKPFFLINRHAKLIYCLFVQSEKASGLSFLSGEFSVREELEIKRTFLFSFISTHRLGFTGVQKHKVAPD